MKYIYILTAIAIMSSCSLKPNCEVLAEIDRKEECLLIFEELPIFTSYSLDAKGKHLLTGKPCTCSDKGRWWATYKEYLEPGDTIIKRKGELTFNIHKKDTILSFDWECEGEIYK